NPRAIQAMRGVGIDISNQKSDPIDMEVLNNATMIVTLCGDAADRCPMTPSHIKREHWGFDDPAKTEGTDEEKQAVFQRVRYEKESSSVRMLLNTHEDKIEAWLHIII